MNIKRKIKLNSDGFNHVEIIVGILVIAILAFIGVRILNSSHAAPKTNNHGVNFSVKGNKIVYDFGKQFIPYGFVVWCLSSPDLSCNQHTSQYPNSDSDKITAAAKYWHANVVRIQVADQNLYNSDGTVDSNVVSQLDSEVNLANSLGMVAIISQQTERYNGSLMPDSSSIQFWTFMAKHYHADHMVFFDLFNEPRLNTKEFNGTESDVWNIWQNGGQVTLNGNNSPTTYVGMQALVNTVRKYARRNIIIAEGNHGDHDLSQLTTHLLQGNNLAYGQEPDLSAPNPAYSFWLNNADENIAEWAANWGNLSNTYPIIVEAFQDHPGSFCYSNSSTVFPELLSYLQSKKMGMIFYSLDPGLAPIGNNLESTTSFTNGSFSCAINNKTANSANTVGPGADLLNWFKANSKPI